MEYLIIVVAMSFRKSRKMFSTSHLSAIPFRVKKKIEPRFTEFLKRIIFSNSQHSINSRFNINLFKQVTIYPSASTTPAPTATAF